MWEEESAHRRQFENMQEQNEFQIRMKELVLQEKTLASKEKDASMNFNMSGKNIQIKGRGQIASTFLILAALGISIAGTFAGSRLAIVTGAILALLLVLILKGAEATPDAKSRDQEHKLKPDPQFEEYVQNTSQP